MAHDLRVHRGLQPEAPKRTKLFSAAPLLGCVLALPLALVLSVSIVWASLHLGGG
ncbi:MAG: hypothetical protein KatS3mg077_1187 [Candidatus Binatia bacterium]|nr:MAG: hypothetical protein KatS3mg077_1187 [Candidatus Binatia bacterium]